jgi:ABC-type polysaccharide/polyol phosphate transport system ATPase subunit
VGGGSLHGELANGQPQAIHCPVTGQPCAGTTGRENVIMDGAILGFDTREMNRRLEAISRFAEIGSFLDHPVKIYSSRMFMRLAFATEGIQ